MSRGDVTSGKASLVVHVLLFKIAADKRKEGVQRHSIGRKVCKSRSQNICSRRRHAKDRL